jgi:hypothetical protein
MLSINHSNRRWLSSLSAPALLALMIAVMPAHASQTGTLKLKVLRCQTPQWIADARVDVEVRTPGGSTIDTAYGYTNNQGYVEFTFTNLDDKDEAKVTVTPSGEHSDGNHTYYWVAGSDRSPGLWDFDFQLDSLCSDGWYDQSNDIIQCVYH